MTETPKTKNSLSKRPLGYLLAVLGGLPGSPLGLLTSPAVLFLLNKSMKGKEGKQPNIFAVWALIGIIGAPISLAIGNPGAFKEVQQAANERKEAIKAEIKEADTPDHEEPKKPVPVPR